MKKASPNPKANKNIIRITYVIVGLFLSLAVYLGYFIQVGSEDVINNSYNARLDSFSDRIFRGNILAEDGTVLAQTQIDEDGNESRVYTYGSVFDHVVGYSARGKTGIEAMANFYLLTSHVNLIEQILGDRKGAVIAMEPDTGKILAMVSKPGYDPNTLLQDWEELTGDRNGEGRLLNRATQGLYPPGSTFKIVTALAYMRERPDDYKDYQFDCSGVYSNGKYQIKCYHSTAHGRQNLTQAFANSCNGAFASLGLEMDLGNFNEITPIHSAMITAAIANGGTLMKPYFLDSVVSAGGEEIKKFMPSSYGSLMTAKEAADLTELMQAVVTEGTASGARTDAYTVAAKTGSAEFEAGKETHAWFTGFAPAESPRLVVTVLVEEGGSGGKAAVPIARQLFDLYMSR